MYAKASRRCVSGALRNSDGAPFDPADNQGMQALRDTRLARLWLVWFALFVAVAVASPILRPITAELVCSASGTAKLVVSKDDPASHPGAHGLDCPLCLTTAAPPPFAWAGPEPLPALGRAGQPIPAARIAALSAAPLPARGPPAPIDA
jgi:hypothetical protein